MTGRSQELYEVVLEKIKEIVRRENPTAFNRVKLMISDFETAIRNAMERAFPGARARGCWFHYGQVCYCRYIAF